MAIEVEDVVVTENSAEQEEEVEESSKKMQPEEEKLRRSVADAPPAPGTSSPGSGRFLPLRK